jgi:hypothetical protein
MSLKKKKKLKKLTSRNQSFFRKEYIFYILYIIVVVLFVSNIMVNRTKADVGRSSCAGIFAVDFMNCDDCSCVEEHNDDGDTPENGTFNGSNSSEPRDNTSCSTAITTTTSTNGDVKTFTYELTPDSDGQAWAYLKGTNPTGFGTKLLYLGDESGAASNVYQCNKWGGSVDKLTSENFTQVCVKFGSTLQCG